MRISDDVSALKLSNGGSPDCTSPTESCLSSISDDSSTTASTTASSKQDKSRSPSSSHVHFSNKQSVDFSKDVSFVVNESSTASTKSNLKRSKSFGAADQVYVAALSFDRHNVSLDNNHFVIKACQGKLSLF